MKSDKARLKRCKKDAELARNALNKLKQGQRFYNSFDWGYKLADILLSLERRLQNIEDHILAATLKINRRINTGAFIGQEIIQTLNASSFVGQVAIKTVNSDAEVL